MLRYMVTGTKWGSTPQRAGTVTLTWKSTLLSLVGGRLCLTGPADKAQSQMFADGIPANSRRTGRTWEHSEFSWDDGERAGPESASNQRRLALFSTMWNAGPKSVEHMEKTKMIGGNAKKGWLYKTRNPGCFDIVEHKQRLHSFSRGLRLFMESAEEITMEELMDKMNPATKESGKNFRRTYI